MRRPSRQVAAFKWRFMTLPRSGRLRSTSAVTPSTNIWLPTRPPRGTIRVQPAMSPNSNECDGNMLVPLKQFGSASQTEIVLGLLRSSGIPVVHAGEYNPRAPNQILVPAKCIADAYRLIADIGDVAPKSIPTAEQFADEPRPF